MMVKQDPKDKRKLSDSTPDVPTAEEKARPEPPSQPKSAAGPEMELVTAPPKDVEGVPEELQEEAEREGAGSSFPIVGIGASAGGLEASKALLARLRTDTGMAFVFVHHLSAEHESLMQDILSRSTSMPVHFARDGMRVEPDHVYVSPPGSFLALFHGTLNLMRPTEEMGSRTSIDYFLRSLSEDQRSMSIGVILSGTGSDGSLGLRAIKAEDGITFAQDPATAAYDGMPRAAIAAGAADIVLDTDGIAAELGRIASHPYLRNRGAAEPANTQAEEDKRQLERIFLMLREAAGVDFTYYKPTTVRRRISRRMAVHKIDHVGDYAKLLSSQPDEIKALYQDLLINVTGFFREPESFEALKTEVFPRLLEGRGQADTVRIWVPACSTGEEPYSIAMAYHEFLDGRSVRPELQIFATDISDTSIEKARAARFPENIEGQMSSERLHRFFNHVDGGYLLNKAIRDSCVFAKHDVTRDPPFSRLDLISCRNLLIYLGQSLQRRLIPVFHYALHSQGFLFLGSSESVGEFNNLFTLVDQKFKIYAKKPVASRPPIEFGFRQYPIPEVVRADKSERGAPIGRVLNVQKEADRIAMERFVPPSVLVDTNLEILQFRGDTTPFLRHAPGRASLDLLDMARQGLDTALRAKVPSLQNLRSTLRVDGVQVRQNDHFRTVDLEIVPVSRIDDSDHFLIFFREPTSGIEHATGSSKARGAKSGAAEIEQVRRDLEQTREQLRLTVEEKDASLEELRAANEEIQSSNEELQSINEELETAKEELQSTNEELTTLNEELQNRNFELQSINDDLRNVLSSVNVPIIILGRDLRIRRYTPMAERALSLIPSDVGRPVTDLKLKIDVPDLYEIVTEVLKELAPVERWVTDETGRKYRLQVRPYRTAEDKIEGVVIALLDVVQQEEETRGQQGSPGTANPRAK